MDDKLLLEAIEGDEDALAQLLVGCDADLRNQLAGQIGRRYRSALGLDDVLQITYMEAFLRIHLFKPDGDRAFLRWLVCIAKNNIRDGIRELDRKKRPPRGRNVESEGTEKSYQTLLSTLAGTQASPSRQVARNEIRNLLEEGLSRLPPDYEAVVRIFDLEGCSAQQVATRMGRTAGAVHMLKARAHDRLAEVLGHESSFFSHCA